MKRKLNSEDVPEAITPEVGEAAVATDSKPTFASLSLDARILQAITREKFSEPTAVQAATVPLALSGKDILARSKTGSGKTLAYLFPIIHSILRRKASSTRPPKAVSALLLVPTKELASQVTSTIKTFTTFCAQDIRAENLTKKEDSAVTRARLLEQPDIVISTPSRASQWISSDVLKPNDLLHVVIDEADLVLSYGYEEDLQSIASSLPTGVQTILMSATLRTEVDSLTSLFCKSGSPEILDLSEQEATEAPQLSQYIVKTAEDEKFLLIYAIFKLQLIKGKVIVFVADIDRCYRIKLFLEQFGIRSCVLNSELPVNSRLHTVDEFNRGVYDIIIAADDNEVVGGSENKRKSKKTEEPEEAMEDAVEDGENEDEQADKEENEDKKKDGDSKQPPSKKRKAGREDREFGVSRGIDFRHVSCVLNFDLPTSAKSYTHRIGRTARAGQKGMALSFYVPRELYKKHKSTTVPQCENDEKVLERIKTRQNKHGAQVDEWQFDTSKLEGFRYRLADAIRSVTRIAVREARTKELRQELINSTKLQRHFEEHPEDLRHLRHDTESHAVRQQPHLRHVPEYLLPSGGKAAIKKDVGFVGMRKDSTNRIRKAREFNKKRGKGKIAAGKGADPLKSLNARGRGKK
ncbi:hypothetical protein WHR41_08685 [Cladosporium halotolerans]|uniref:RNA helicase n=1 Tax=Cladosporium halotolerans TaxID=1052096 RepID=A0AB34KCL1_9PEZI